jgi:hypothetical protein
LLLSCGCGLSIPQHHKSALINYESKRSLLNDLKEWQPDDFFTVEDEDTDAFGQIRFNNNSDLISKVFFSQHVQIKS